MEFNLKLQDNVSARPKFISISGIRVSFWSKTWILTHQIEKSRLSLISSLGYDETNCFA